MLIRTSGESSYFFRKSASILPQTSFLIFSTSGRDECRVSFALTASFSTLYCENSVIINWNSLSVIWLSARALESSRSTVSHFAMASVTISWCFLSLNQAFCWRLSAPKKLERMLHWRHQVELWQEDQQKKEWSQNSRLKMRWKNTRAGSTPVNNFLGTFIFFRNRSIVADFFV